MSFENFICTFTKSARAKIIAASISSLICFRSADCGMPS